MTEQADKAAIRGIIEGIDKALHDRDAEAVVAGFATDALLFDLAPPLSRKIKVEDVAAWLGAWEGPVTRETRDLEITVNGELAFAHGYFRTNATTKDRGERVEWWSRATLCFTRRTGEWLIVHEHTSVPFYMDGSFRAAIDLKPQRE
jgi:ketosteroid isomerase-like protein